MSGNIYHNTKNRTRGIGFNILLHGLPGTGKSEFVKYLADVSDLKLVYKKSSDLQSSFVGETEKKIASAFRMAEEEVSILFLDEADSLFSNREFSNRSWETSRTNELLSQMENFSGFLVCATNLPEMMDSAVLRRFAWKIEFKALHKDQRLPLYKSYFGQTGILSEEDERKILSMEGLTPGICETVRAKFEFEEPRNMAHALIVEALLGELRLTKRITSRNEARVGF